MACYWKITLRLYFWNYVKDYNIEAKEVFPRGNLHDGPVNPLYPLPSPVGCFSPKPTNTNRNNSNTKTCVCNTNEEYMHAMVSCYTKMSKWAETSTIILMKRKRKSRKDFIKLHLITSFIARATIKWGHMYNIHNILPNFIGTPIVYHKHRPFPPLTCSWWSQLARRSWQPLNYNIVFRMYGNHSSKPPEVSNAVW